MNSIQVVWTVIAFLIFVGIVLWAYSSKQKERFSEAAQLPLSDDAIDQLTLKRENDNG